MMSTCCSKHVEAWNKYIKKECVNLVINQNDNLPLEAKSSQLLLFKNKVLHVDCQRQWITQIKIKQRFIIQTNKCTTHTHTHTHTHIHTYIYIYIYINKILQNVSSPTCFNASASSSGSLILSILQKLPNFCNFKKQKYKTPWRWCRCTETCRSTYDI
jgi:hypothetical protein